MGSAVLIYRYYIWKHHGNNARMRLDGYFLC